MSYLGDFIRFLRGEIFGTGDKLVGFRSLIATIDGSMRNLFLKRTKYWRVSNSGYIK